MNKPGWLGVCLAFVLISGCGGSDDVGSGVTVAPPPLSAVPTARSNVFDRGLQAALAGSISGASTRDVIAIVDGVGGLWAWYGTHTPMGFQLTGAIAGVGEGRPATTRIRPDFASEVPAPGTLHSRHESWELAYDAANSMLSGTIGTGESARTISASALSGFDLTAPATLEAVRGNWTLKSLDGRTLDISIDAQGNILGSGECRISGSIWASRTGRNIYMIILGLHGPAGIKACSGLTEGFGDVSDPDGVAILRVLPDGRRQLMVSMIDRGWNALLFAAVGTPTGESNRADLAASMLAAIPSVHLPLMSSSFYYTHGNSGEVALPSGSCVGGSGSLLSSLDDATISRRGVLPAGRHVYAVSFDNCVADGLIGIRLHGTAAMAYATENWSNVEGNATVGSIRATGSLSSFGRILDATAHGSAHWSFAQSSGTATTKYAPAAGTVLINNGTGNVATFSGGSYSQTWVSGPPFVFTREFADLAFAINGTRLVLSGSLAQADQARYEGELRITRDGVLLGRLYGDMDRRLRAEVLHPIPEF